MRVIAGTVRGRPLVAPPGLKTRPTADRFRESLFNILAPSIPGSHFLDLFSGSGAIGIEALSRGAHRCDFVDCSRDAMGTIKRNLTKTGLTDRAGLYLSTAERAIHRLAREGKRFDIIFMDPPYQGAWAAKTLEHLAKTPVLTPGGVLIAEMPSRTDVPTPAAFTLERIKEYGNTRFVFYQSASLEEPR